jgi:uncharacterized protein (TIGR02145 family)
VSGETVAIDAGTPPTGQRFKNWTTATSGVTFANANSAATTFTMPASAVTVTANFEQIPTTPTYAVTVTSAGAGASGAGSYSSSDTVSIDAGTPPTGQRFKNWTTTTSGVTFADANSAATTFTMPARAVTVTANFEQIPTTPTANTVTVVSDGVGASGGGSYMSGEKVTITAGIHPSGLILKSWTTTSNGVVFADSTSVTTTFTMPNNAVTVTAIFGMTFETFTDDRDSKTYKMLTISVYTWMAENLNFETPDSWCYNNDVSACNKYGRLYTWNAATTACPTGWHLPTNAEWNAWVNYVGSSTAGTKLKSKSPDWNGSDDYGFSALPGGYRNTDGNFGGLGSEGNWWTGSDNFSNAYFKHLETNGAVVGGDGALNRGYGISVRCLKN